MRSFSRLAFINIAACTLYRSELIHEVFSVPLIYSAYRGVQTTLNDSTISNVYTSVNESGCNGDKGSDEHNIKDAKMKGISSPYNTPVHREEVYAEDYAINVKNALHDKDEKKEEELIHMWRDTPNGESGIDVIEKYGATFKDPRPIDPNEPIDIKRRRLVYQSRYRGMVEMDLILGHFARCKLESLDRVMLNEYDILLKQLDNDLFNWIVMDFEIPKEIASLKCFSAVREFVKNNREELLKAY